MYPVSDNCKKALRAHFREGQNAIVAFDDLTLENRWIRSVSFSHLLNDSEYLQLGSISSKKVEITLNDVDGSLRNTLLSGRYFTLSYQIIGETIPIGTFRVDGDPDKSEKSIVQLTAFDRLYYADVKYYCMLGQSYTAKDLLQDVLAQCSIELASEEILESINYDIKQTYVPENVTCRQVISMCAEVAGCMAVMNRNDKLEFLPITNTMEISDTLDIGNCYDMTFAEDDYVVDGMRYYESDDSFLKAGEGKKRIICLSSSNFLVNQKVLDNLYERVKGLSFRPFKCPRFDGDPSIDAGDILTVSNLNGTQTYRIMPLVIGWSFDGGLKGNLENPVSTSATVNPKNTTTLDQKINQTYYEKAGVTYAYNNEKVVLGARETPLCDIKFANSYGNIPTGAIGISGLFTPGEDGSAADISMRFVADDAPLPYYPIQHMTVPGKYVVYAPLVMYMLGSGDHYFQAYASISSGSFAIEPEQFTLHVLTIGTGGGVKSPDTYISTVFDKITLKPFSIGKMDIQFNAVPTIQPQQPITSVISNTVQIHLEPLQIPAMQLKTMIAGVNEKRIIFADTVFFNNLNKDRFIYDFSSVVFNETMYINTDYETSENVFKEVDSGHLSEIKIEKDRFKQINTWEVRKV